MDNFIFSINVTLPVFLVMVLGWFLRQKGMFDEPFINKLDRFNFNVTLPILLFRDITAVNIREVFDLKYVLFCAISSTICFWLIWGFSKIALKDKSMTGAFVQASTRSSAAVMGLAFIQNIYGNSAMGPLMIIGAVPLYNIFSVVVLTVEGDNFDKQGENKVISTCVNIIKNPIIIAIILGLIVSLCNIQFSTIVNKTVNSVAQIASPLSLIGLGAAFEGKKALTKIKPALLASVLKLIVQPAIFIPVAIYFGFTGEKIIGIMIMLAAPASPSCYIMAKNMKNDSVLTSSIIVLTTLLAAFTLTGWIFLLKQMGMI